MKFTFSNPTTLFFGQGKISAITKAISKQARVLVIYGGGSIKRNGIYEQVANALQDYTWFEFSGVETNPSLQTMTKAVALIKQEKIDFVLAVGGGSVIDGSKFACAAALYDGDGWDIMTGKHRVKKALPLGAILTLPATGSESNCTSVISNTDIGAKLAFVAPAVFPQFAVLDPDVIKTLPERQLANGIVDAFIHVCEQYLTKPTAALVQEAYAEGLMRSLLTLGESYDKRDSDQWRANLMLCCNQALNGFIGSGVPQDWATHMMGHEITAAYHVDHARSLAIVQPSLLRHQIEVKRAKLEQLGQQVFGLAPSITLAEQTINKMEAFYQSLQLATTLSGAIGDTTGAVEKIISQLKTNGMTVLGENGVIDLTASEEILTQAL